MHPFSGSQSHWFEDVYIGVCAQISFIFSFSIDQTNAPVPPAVVATC